MWVVVYLPEAECERDQLPANERVALHNAVVKLEGFGPALGYLHTSAVKGVAKLRELRPGAGRSSWRRLYRQFGDTMVSAAYSAEALHDPRGFKRSCGSAAHSLMKPEERMR